MITRNFDLMLFKNGTAPCINVSQYDQGETWVFTLYGQGGVKYTPTTGAIVALKSDGHLIANAGTVDGQGRVVITETEQMTASAGKAVCELQIDGDTHGTANFYLLVEPSPADGGIASDSDLSLFQQTVDAVSTIETLLDGEDPNDVIETAVDAWLDDHPEATTTVLDGAITIPKLNDSVLDLLIAESASGNPAVISDGAKNVPVKSLVAEIVPIQSGSGDPAPDNVRPISGHTEVKVCRLSTNEYDATYRTTGKALGTNGSVVNSVVSFVSNYVNVEGWEKAIVAYTYAELANSTNRVICFYDSTKTFINDAYISYSPTTKQQEYTIPNGAVYMRVTLDNNVTNIVIGKGTTKTVSLGTTVYGGTLDIVSGVLTVTHGYADMGDMEGWTYDASVPRFYTSGLQNLVKKPASNAQVASIKSSAYYATALDTMFAQKVNGTMAVSAAGSISIINTAYTNAATFKTAMSGVQLVYPLATPITTQLTAQEVTTLLGDNVITASSGQVAVIYRADTKMYVDNEISKAKTIIAGIETGFTATKNYTTGNLLIIGDDLYKVTANIANGSAITVNTNVTKTTVAEQLIALA